MGVLFSVVGTDGGRVKAQVPAVADTGGETDEDGHWALCAGELTSCPLENWHKQRTPKFVKHERWGQGWGAEQRKAREKRQSKEGIKGKK